MIDAVFQLLYSRSATSKWMRRDELAETLRRQGLTQQEWEALEDFLWKYFVEVDESQQWVRLNSRTQTLVGISTW